MSDLKFTVNEKRCLGIPLNENPDDAAALALREVINAFPWIIHVADYRFDQRIIEAGVLMEKRIQEAKREFELALEIYRMNQNGK